MLLSVFQCYYVTIMNQKFIFPPPKTSAIPVQSQDKFYPVRRIYCVGRNYSAHAREMGKDPTKEPPFFFTKQPDNIFPTGGLVQYPPGTDELHYEAELVVALRGGGMNISRENAISYVYGYAVGIDLTRRDLQNEAKKMGRPWDFSKSFNQSAPISNIFPADIFTPSTGTQLTLKVNGVLKQNAMLSDMIWNISEIISYLSAFYVIREGDIIFTGTPAGVGSVVRGDKITASISGLTDLQIEIV